jgi:hypothetical protein
MHSADEEIRRRPQDDKHRNIEKSGMPDVGVGVRGAQKAAQNKGGDKGGNARDQRYGYEDTTDFNLAAHDSAPG